MDLKKEFPVSAQKVADGVEKTIGDATFLMSYSQSSKAQLSLITESQRIRASGLSVEEAAILALRYVLVNTLVLDWSNLKEDGVEIQYSKENCARILEEYEGLDVTLMEKSMNIADFKAEIKSDCLGK